jgi:RNA polymerase sigma-70 factor (ECF subfamily)
MSSVAELVVRARAGDQAAFAALYDRHSRLVRAICFDATGHLAAAEDLSQEVFLRAYQKLHQLRDANRFLAWLCEIARRAGRDWRRRAKRDCLSTDFVEKREAATSAEESTLIELRDAIRQLPEDERIALHLFYLDEQPAADARQVLGLSQSGFYKLLDRARQHVALNMRRDQEAFQ